MNNYTEKGQTKSLGNGRCTDEKRNQRPDDILVGHLISFFIIEILPNSLLSSIVFNNKPSKDLDMKKCD